MTLAVGVAIIPGTSCGIVLVAHALEFKSRKAPIGRLLENSTRVAKSSRFRAVRTLCRSFSRSRNVASRHCLCRQLQIPGTRGGTR
jgi:hypothetical protein